ncbi:DUF6929 family protein [Cesiribacter andamanensis]|nr:hypothetical protein [Cesiribacter andamanensis]
MPHTPAPYLQLQRSKLLPAVSSGSGLALVSDSLYLVGDDAPYLYRLTADWELQERVLLFPAYEDSSRIPKQAKPDLESLFTLGEGPSAVLYALGSGSLSPQRDVLLQIPLQAPGQFRQYSLTPFYNHLANRLHIGREQLNLEGALVLEEQLYLFNRGTNSLIRLSWSRFAEFLQGILPAEQLSLEIHPLQLPSIAGKLARISGACVWPGTSKILFTATVEDTENWIDDGDILGSFIGLLDSRQPEQDLTTSSWLLLDPSGNPLLEKLESLDVAGQKGQTLELVAVADNDNGSSTLFALTLDFGEETLRIP